MAVTEIWADSRAPAEGLELIHAERTSTSRRSQARRDCSSGFIATEETPLSQSLPDNAQSAVALRSSACIQE